MRVRYSRLALAGLDAILANLAQQNPVAAQAFAERVQRVIHRISEFPESAPQVIERPNVRRIPLVRYPYAIHYTVSNSEVIILRILHGARRSPW
jgi:toxin ParE1/3/4